jgi:hypothetical protein
MQSFTIKSHAKNRVYSKPHFFILCKGNNSGKPLTAPCPNCFVLECESGQKDLLYWMLWGLWKSRAFHPFLRGSVIPFIVLSDAREVLKTALEKSIGNKAQLAQSVKFMRTLEELEKNYLNNLALVQDARRAVFYKYMRK